MGAAARVLQNRWSMTDLGDSELMARYSAGSAASFAELFRRYEGRAYAYFLRRAGSESLAQDLYQELFLRLHRFRDRFDPGRPFGPWFFQIAHNVLADERRRALRSREQPLDEFAEPAQEGDPERTAAARQLLERALGSLSGGDAFVVLAAKGAGRDYAAIGAELGKSTAAVKQMASRSLRRLRAALGAA
jgi:RNA polymerase sigma-70 factor (ECF subfamily)